MIQLEGIECAMYCRYSTYLQKDTSIEDQINANTDFSASRGWKINEKLIFIDRCTRGTKYQREGLDSLLQLAKSGKAQFKYILVYDTSRLARLPLRTLLEANELSFCGVQRWTGLFGQLEPVFK